MPSSWPTRPTGSATLTPLPDSRSSSADQPVELTGALLREGAERLASAGSETPRLDAELLLGHAVGVGRTGVLAHPEGAGGAWGGRRCWRIRGRVSAGMGLDAMGPMSSVELPASRSPTSEASR